MTNQVNHALTLQSELKIITAQLFEMVGVIDYKKFGWDIELTEDNWIDPDIWLGKDYATNPQENSDDGLISFKPFIDLVKFKLIKDGFYQVEFEVDLPYEFNIPKKLFQSTYEYIEGEPMQGFPDAMYEAYKYFDKVTTFTYGDKLAHLTEAMWDTGRNLDFFCKPDHYEEQARFVKEDIVA